MSFANDAVAFWTCLFCGETGNSCCDVACVRCGLLEVDETSFCAGMIEPGVLCSSPATVWVEEVMGLYCAPCAEEVRRHYTLGHRAFGGPQEGGGL